MLDSVKRRFGWIVNCSIDVLHLHADVPLRCTSMTQPSNLAILSCRETFFCNFSLFSLTVKICTGNCFSSLNPVREAIEAMKKLRVQPSLRYVPTGWRTELRTDTLSRHARYPVFCKSPLSGVDFPIYLGIFTGFSNISGQLNYRCIFSLLFRYLAHPMRAHCTVILRKHGELHHRRDRFG